MMIGYARVSKIDQQDTRAQVKVLKEAGCKRIFEESASGVVGIGLNCTGHWTKRDGDVLVVWKVDRLSRSLKDMLNILEKITEVGALKIGSATRWRRTFTEGRAQPLFASETRCSNRLFHCRKKVRRFA